MNWYLFVAQIASGYCAFKFGESVGFYRNTKEMRRLKKVLDEVMQKVQDLLDAPYEIEEAARDPDKRYKMVHDLLRPMEERARRSSRETSKSLGED